MLTVAYAESATLSNGCKPPPSSRLSTRQLASCASRFTCSSVSPEERHTDALMMSTRSRSPLGTTVAQIASRLALVWGVCEFFPQVIALSSRVDALLERKRVLSRSFCAKGTNSPLTFASLAQTGRPLAVLRLDGDRLVVRRDDPLHALRDRLARDQDQGARVASVSTFSRA